MVLLERLYRLVEEPNIDEWFTNIGKHTMGEPDILRNIEPSSEPYTMTVPTWLPKVMTESGLRALPETIEIPPSKFANYCKTVLDALLNQYLANAQIIKKMQNTIICHGGLLDAKGLHPNDEYLNTVLPGRDQAGFLTRIGEQNMNSVIAGEAVSEIQGRAPLCDVNTLKTNPQYDACFGEEDTKLVIVGHTPTTIGVPVFVQKGDRWLIQTDTQRTNRTTNHSCTCFNEDGTFCSVYTVQHDSIITSFDKRVKEKLTVFMHNGVEQKGEDGFYLNGYVIQPSVYVGFEVYVKCTQPDTGFNTQPKIELRRPNGARYDLYDKLNLDYSYYTWGDVEGSLAFLNGCYALLEKFKSKNRPHYVSLGDTIGVPDFKNVVQGETSDSKTLEYAIQAEIKIIGNRDFNKMRVLAEYIHWKKNSYKIAAKNDLALHTYAYKLGEGDQRLDRTWVHDSKVSYDDASPSIVMNWGSRSPDVNYQD